MIDLNDDIQVLSATIDGEAEGEPPAGQIAVGWSAKNRALLARIHPHFGNGSIRSACLFPAQYNCWLPGPDRDRIMALDFDHPTPAFARCITVAKGIIAGTIADPTGGATYYYDPEIEGPPWLVGAKWRGQFGSQLFWGNVK